MKQGLHCDQCIEEEDAAPDHILSESGNDMTIWPTGSKPGSCAARYYSAENAAVAHARSNE
jgi:hypothetical protein